MHKTFQVGAKTFVLDQAKAEATFAAKKVINGRQTMCFNLLPLKYQWAYDLYRKMKANHWEPEDIPMGKDIEQWRDEKVVSDAERWIIRMGIGYFSAAEGIVGAYVSPDMKLGALVEINCETDFVARNEDFVAFAKSLAEIAATRDPGPEIGRAHV